MKKIYIYIKRVVNDLQRAKGNNVNDVIANQRICAKAEKHSLE